MIELLGLSRLELRQSLAELVPRPFHADNVFRWIYQARVYDPEQWSDLSKPCRAALKEACQVTLPKIVEQRESTDGTRRFLLQIGPEEKIEVVYIPDGKRRTICISSEVGCAMGCTFCMTATLGLKRTMTAGEIVGQVLLLMDETDIGEGPFNIVYMGMGEPLNNIDQVKDSFLLLSDQKGMDIARRRITISTSGLAPAIDSMAKWPALPRIALSLNATQDETRSRIMPVNRKWNIERLMTSLENLPLSHRERLFFEYVLFSGVNDTEADARRLARFAHRVRAKVNLIAFNPTPELPEFNRPTDEHIRQFQTWLRNMDVMAFIRKSRGTDIFAACGQLHATDRAENPMKVADHNVEQEESNP